MDASRRIPDWPPRQIVLATLTALAVVAGFALLVRFRGVVLILFIGFVIGTAITPAVEWLRERDILRPNGVVLVYGAILGLSAGIILLVAPLLVEQLTDLLDVLPDFYKALRTTLLRTRSSLIQQIGLQMPPSLALIQIKAAVEGEEAVNVARAWETAGLALRWLIATLGALLLGFYWTMEGERTIRTFILLLPRSRRQGARELIEAVQFKVGRFIRGQALLSLIIGVAALLVYSLIGLPYALVLGFIAGIMEAIPVFGPALGAIPAVLVALSLDPTKVIWVLVATGIIQALENYFLLPRVMDESVGVNPIVTLLSLVTFATLFGLAGGILAIPTAAIIQLLLDRFLLDPAATEPPQIHGRDRVDVLRYEVRDLVQDVRKQVRHKESLAGEGTDELEDAIETVAHDLDNILAAWDNVENAKEGT